MMNWEGMLVRQVAGERGRIAVHIFGDERGHVPPAASARYSEIFVIHE